MLFLVSGAGLLAIVYALVAAAPPLPINTKSVFPTPQPHSPVQHKMLSFDAVAAQLHTAELHQLLFRFAIALLIMAAASVVLGWIVAGRVLRPLRTMTVTTQRISEENLHQRISLPGPNDELKDLADTVDSLLARLEGAFDSQRNFVANASHELRTPLTLVRTLVQAQLRAKTPDLQSFRATCEEVLDATQEQERLIDALLTLARSQRGLERRETFELSTVVDNVLLSSDLDHRGIEVDAAIGPALINGDRRLVEQIVRNLVDNAIRYNKPGGRVDIAVSTRSGHAILAVSNTGPAIDDMDVDRLFQPFQRLGPNRSGAGEGTGLGLSIVKAISGAHQATVSATPQPAGGLRIEVAFPHASRRPDGCQSRPPDQASGIRESRNGESLTNGRQSLDSRANPSHPN